MLASRAHRPVNRFLSCLLFAALRACGSQGYAREDTRSNHKEGSISIGLRQGHLQRGLRRPIRPSSVCPVR